jgi:tetratricopeptide (TPR) repeat protein
VTVAVAMALLIGSVVTNRFSEYLRIDDEFGLGVSRLHSPSDAVDFMQANGIDGQPFNCLVTGGYLAWRLFPAQRVFVDGRLEAFPEEFFALYFRTLDDPQSWPLVANRYGLDYALLYHRWSNRIPLAQYLASGHGWTMVYYDEISSLFVRDDADAGLRERAAHAFAELQARRAAAPPSPPSIWQTLVRPLAEIKRQTVYGEFLRSMGKPGEAAVAFARALALAPDVSETRFKLGAALWFSGKRDQAIVEWRDVLRRDPTFERARAALAEVGAGS